MQEELIRSNTIGDSRGILYFASTILKDDVIVRDSARKICSFVDGIRIDFNAAVALFEYLELIRTEKNALVPTEEGRALYSFIQSGFEEKLCEKCLSRITIDEVIDIEALRFDVIQGKYYIQRYGFPMAAAVFRNMLIQLNALSERGDSSGSLEISERYETIFAKILKKKKRRMSIEALKKKLEQQEIQGEIAEEYVLKYERKRFSDVTLHVKVKRISGIDVTAGYDIVSFENSTSGEYDKFIEVKSFKGQPHFYWSKNEIEVATLYGDKYYLYMVDMDKIEGIDYIPTVIKNPVMKVIESGDWLMQPTSYLVLPTVTR